MKRKCSMSWAIFSRTHGKYTADVIEILNVEQFMEI